MLGPALEAGDVVGEGGGDIGAVAAEEFLFRERLECCAGFGGSRVRRTVSRSEWNRDMESA